MRPLRRSWLLIPTVLVALTGLFILLDFGAPADEPDPGSAVIPRDVPGDYRSTLAWTPPTAAPRTASTGAMALSPNGQRLFTANRDPGTVSIIDTEAAVTLVEISVGREPRSVSVDPTRPRIYVTNFADASFSVVDIAQGRTVATVATAHEPYGIVVSPDGEALYVSAAGADVVQEFELTTLSLVRSLPVEPNPRGLAVAASGRALYVTHFLSGRVSAIDLDSGGVTALISTGDESAAAQFIAWHPSDGTLYLPHSRSRVSNATLSFDTTVAPLVSVIDLAEARGVAAEPLQLAQIDRPVNLPAALDFSPDGRLLYVVNSGSNDLSIIELETGVARGHLELGANPGAIVVARVGDIAYAYNALSYDISVVDLEQLSVIETIVVSTSPLSPEVQRGKELFFSSSSPELARDQWVSCAVCHLDGLQDGRTWPFVDGPRNTLPIRGLAQTAPFHWSGDRVDLFDFQKTIKEVQGGTGLSQADNAALAAFLSSTSVRPSPHLTADGALTPPARRGRELFFARACSNCHAGPAFADGSIHDVGTGPPEGGGSDRRFETPSLLGLYDSEPFLHDGSAESLLDVLTVRNPNDRHGQTSDLTAAQVDDLIAFLSSLPFG